MKKLLPIVLWVTVTATIAGAEPSSQIPHRWSAEEAVAFALENSPDTAIALEKIAAAEAEVALAASADCPLVSISSEYAMTDNPMFSFGNILNQGSFSNDIDFNDPGRTDALTLAATVQYRLYNGGRDTAGSKAAQAGVDAAAAAEKSVRQLLAFEVVKNYEAVLEAQALVDVRQKARQAISSSLKVAQARWKAGDLLKQELLALETELARAEEEIIAARHTLTLTRHSFLALLGLPVQKMILSDRITGLTAPPVITVHRREELTRVRALEDQARAAVDQARGGKLPTVDAFGNWQAEYGPETGGDGTSWSAGVRMNYPLFDGHRTEATEKKARARLRELGARRKKIEMDLELDLNRAKSSLGKAEKRVAVTRKAEKAATEAARLSRVQFKEGTVLASELIDYEVRLAEARTHHLSAKAERIVALANLRRAAGYLPFEQNTSAEKKKND